MSTIHLLASLCGYSGAALLFFQVVLGSRHVFSFFTTNTVAINRLHKQIGIYGTLLVFMHPLLEMMWQGATLLWIVKPNFSMEMETHISFGRIALYFAIIIWITSAIIREKIKWRPWKYLHLLAYPLLLLTFFHVPDIGTLFSDYLAVRVIWYALFALFIVATVYRLLKWGGVGKKKIQVIKLGMQGETILLLTASYPEGLVFPTIGQHVYLQEKGFGSEHPFTVMDVDETLRTISFGMRTGGPFVTSLTLKKPGDTILFDGPYGVFTQEARNEEKKVIIAGGVGITPFVRLAREFGKNGIFLYCNRVIGDAVEREMIKSHVSRYVDILEQGEASEGVMIGRLDAALLAKILEKENIQILPYFVCGSPFFIGIMTKTLLGLGVPKGNIYYEELGF